MILKKNMKFKKCVPNLYKKIYVWLKYRSSKKKINSIYVKFFFFFSFITESNFLNYFTNESKIKILFKKKFMIKKKIYPFIFFKFFITILYKKFIHKTKLKNNINSHYTEINIRFKNLEINKILNKRKILKFVFVLKKFLKIYFVSALNFIKRIFFYFFFFNLWTNILKKDFKGWLLKNLVKNIQNICKKRSSFLYDILVFIFKKIVYEDNFKEIFFSSLKKYVFKLLENVKNCGKLNLNFQFKILFFLFYMFKNRLIKDIFVIKINMFFFLFYFFFNKKIDVFLSIAFRHLSYTSNHKISEFNYCYVYFKIILNKIKFYSNKFFKIEIHKKNKQEVFFINKKCSLYISKTYVVWEIYFLSLINFLYKKKLKCNRIYLFFFFIYFNFKKNTVENVKIQKVNFYYNNFYVYNWNFSIFLKLLIIDFFLLKNFLKLFFLYRILLQFLFKIIKNKQKILKYKKMSFFKYKKYKTEKLVIKTALCSWNFISFYLFEFLTFSKSFFNYSAINFIDSIFNKSFKTKIIDTKFYYNLFFRHEKKKLKKEIFIKKILKTKKLIKSFCILENSFLKTKSKNLLINFEQNNCFINELNFIGNFFFIHFYLYLSLPNSERKKNFFLNLKNKKKIFLRYKRNYHNNVNEANIIFYT
nr:hypothetical protein CcurKRNrm3_p071 [Cryptomonas curvata]